VKVEFEVETISTVLCWSSAFSEL